MPRSLAHLLISRTHALTHSLTHSLARNLTQVATASELKELEDTLVLIEAEAINDLNTKQENLPVPSKNLSEVEAAKVQLAEMTWE